MEQSGMRNRRTVRLVFNIIAIVLILAFIFGNSLLDREASGDMSASVLDLLQPIIRPIVEMFTGGEADTALLHTIVRKLAHFSEFAALAFLIELLALQLCGTWRTHAQGYVLFGTLLTAVLDEFLQSFTGRGPSVRDVMIDFSGALCGIAAMLLLRFLIQTIQNHRKGDRS